MHPTDHLPTDPSVLSVLVMEPALKVKPWGGRRLQAELDKCLPADDLPYGESWEVADLAQGQSRVACGAWRGRPLREVVQAWGDRLCGAHGAFPLLVKFLDAREDLSVQVHPGPLHSDPAAGVASKDESWLILSDGGCVYHGFVDDDMTPSRFARALTEGQCMALLRRHDVAAGDVIRVPPGTVHAIGAGVLLLEIQQPSDTTYRLWDHERVGLDGKPRALHIQQGVEVTTFGPQPALTLTPTRADTQPGVARDVLVDVPAYRIERWSLEGQGVAVAPSPRAQVVVCLEGSVRVSWEQWGVTLSKGHSAILPAALGGVTFEGTGVCVTAV